MTCTSPHWLRVIADLHLRYPYRGQYPLAWQREGVKRINDMLLDPNKYGFVSVADATDARAFHDSAGLPVMEGTVLGYSYWARRGESSEDAWMNCRATSNALERTLRRVEDLYEQYVYPNPAESAKNLELLRGTVGNESYRAKLKGVPHWHLLTIAVRSEFQRRGVGKQLLEWGLDPSAQDRTWSVLCPGLSTSPESGDPQIVSLSTTEEGRRLYEKAGFRVICNELGEPEASANVPGTTPFYSMVW